MWWTVWSVKTRVSPANPDFSPREPTLTPDSGREGPDPRGLRRRWLGPEAAVRGRPDVFDCYTWAVAGVAASLVDGCDLRAVGHLQVSERLLLIDALKAADGIAGGSTRGRRALFRRFRRCARRAPPNRRDSGTVDRCGPHWALSPSRAGADVARDRPSRTANAPTFPEEGPHSVRCDPQAYRRLLRSDLSRGRRRVWRTATTSAVGRSLRPRCAPGEQPAG
jgi:hypothetical protein